MSEQETAAQTALEQYTKKAPILIKCEECGTELVRKKNWQRFCSDACRSSWHANWKDREIAKLRAELGEQK